MWDILLDDRGDLGAQILQIEEAFEKWLRAFSTALLAEKHEPIELLALHATTLYYEPYGVLEALGRVVHVTRQQKDLHTMGMRMLREQAYLQVNHIHLFDLLLSLAPVGEDGTQGNAKSVRQF